MHEFLGTGLSLAQLENKQPVEIFKKAEHFPQFFDQHLNDKDRVIKILPNQCHVNERIFYYQYIKLCFEAQEKDAHLLIQNIRDLIFNPDFYFVFNPSDPDFNEEIDTDNQYKRLVFEFMEAVEEKKSFYETLLKKYSIMDKIFVTMLRSLLIFYGQAESIDDPIDREAAFSTLQQIFGLEIKKFGHCIKFVDSDVFVYQESDDEVFIAYIQEENQEENQDSYVCKNSESSSLSIGKDFQTKNILVPEDPKANGRKKNQIYVSNTSSAYDFVDFTSPEYGGLARTKDPLYFDEKDTSAFFQKQKGLQMSATLGRPFQQPSDRKLAASSLEQANIEVNPEKTLDSFQPRLQESIDMGYRIEQIKNKMIKEKQSPIRIQPEQNNTSELNKKPSEATLAQNTSKTSFDADFFNKYEDTKEIDVQPGKPIITLKACSPDTQFPGYKPQQKIFQNSKSSTSFNPINEPIKFEQTYKSHQFPSYNTTQEAYRKNDMYSYESKKVQSVQYDGNSKVSSLRQRIRLNVTKQFSNTAILDKLPQKERQSIIMARQRARAYRKSVQHLF